MTALVDGLRSWWRHRNDPPPMLPDKVTWTHTVRGTDREALDAIEYERAEGWELDDWNATGEYPLLTHSITFIRFDGAYRWRDDSMRGF